MTNIHSPNYFFKEYSDNFPIPIESLGLYMQSIWNTIKNNRNNDNFILDLTESKLVIINFMFETIKNKVYKEILMNSIMTVKKQTNDNEYVNLSLIAEDVFKKSETLFQNYTKNYFKTNEYFQKEKDLQELIKQDFLDIFKKQVTMLRKTSLSQLNELISSGKISCIKFKMILIY